MNLIDFDQSIFDVVLLGQFIVINVHWEGSDLDVYQRRSFGEDLWIVEKVRQSQSG